MYTVTALHVELILGGHVRLKSLGHHRVRDFPHVEEIFQASLPGRDDTFPPLRTGSTRGPAVMAVVLVDICRASKLTASDRDVDLLTEQRRWMSAMRRISEAHGAASIKVLGDGCLVAFEDPANGLAFARSLRAEIAESGLQIRAASPPAESSSSTARSWGARHSTPPSSCTRHAPGQILTSDTLRDSAAARTKREPRFENARGDRGRERAVRRREVMRLASMRGAGGPRRARPRITTISTALGRLREAPDQSLRRAPGRNRSPPWSSRSR